MPNKVFVAVPTGATKEYSMLYMLAALRNLDYAPHTLEVWFAVTMRHPVDEAFHTRLKQLIKSANMPFQVNTLKVRPAEQEKLRWGQYYAVICNLHELRKIFLDGDYTHFWLLGGDNPPPRRTLKALLNLNVDVASAVVYQRPHRGRELDTSVAVPPDQPYPLFWRYGWTLEDLEHRRDLEPELKEALRSLWINVPMMKPVITTQRVKVARVNFGSGCSLSTRRVMEHIGYYLGDAGYASEDIMFGQHANAYGFLTAIDQNVRCLHFDPDGRIF